jgi:RNA recognition motif-containing protein
MIVFLRNIPDDTARQDIIDFVMPAVRGGLFRAKGKITSIDILAIKDGDTGSMEYHGLVYISPDEAGLRAIKKLNGQPFKGRRLTVREYVARSWKNDRRGPPKPPPPPEIGERRKNPTRRGNLKIQRLKAIKPE